MEYLYPKLPESHLKDTIIKKIKRGEPLDHSLLIDLLYEGKYIYLLEQVLNDHGCPHHEGLGCSLDLTEPEECPHGNDQEQIDICCMLYMLQK